MTRSAAFTLARRRVQETGKPYLVIGCDPDAITGPLYDIACAHGEVNPRRKWIAWISVNGSERVYDGLGAPEAAQDPTPGEERER